MILRVVISFHLIPWPRQARGIAYSSDVCFLNLPDTRRSRFGEELNAEKMKKAVWLLKPEAVAQIEFLEWTEGATFEVRGIARGRGEYDSRWEGNSAL
jgi:hypothetical protein